MKNSKDKPLCGTITPEMFVKGRKYWKITPLGDKDGACEDCDNGRSEEDVNGKE